VKITLIYDNEVHKEGLQADWGFSCLVELENSHKILFDTGANGSILLSNMEKLGIDPVSIETVFISHGHFDHVGGLSTFLQYKNDAKIFFPASLEAASGERNFVPVNSAVEIRENVFSTGELARMEQSMAVKTEMGVVLIVGCSHPGMAHILEASSQFGEVRAVVGGLHGFSEFDLFEGLELICPVHCTRNRREIKSLFPDQYLTGGAGQIIML